MKAIHNYEYAHKFYQRVENYGLKYNFESNSQQTVAGQTITISWELWSKIQFWKQFTTK